MTRHQLRTDERGQVAGIEALPFGVLIFVVGALVLAGAWGVVDARSAAAAAARDGANAFIEAPDLARASERARARARETLVDLGRSDPDRADVVIDVAGGRFARCAPVTVSVAYEVPALRLPFGLSAASMTVTGRHTTLVDPHRSSEADRGRCLP